MADATQDHWAITPVAISDLINKQRKQLKRAPVDHAAMMTQLVLRSSVIHPDMFDFEAPELKMNAMEISCMEIMLNDLFRVSLNETLAGHCRFQSTSQDRAIPLSAANKTPFQSISHQSGLVSKLTRMFGRSIPT